MNRGAIFVWSLRDLWPGFELPTKPQKSPERDDMKLAHQFIGGKRGTDENDVRNIIIQTSSQQIPFVIFNPMLFQNRPIFFLKRFLAMMLVLIIDIRDRAINV